MSESVIGTALQHQEHRALGSALRSTGGTGGDGGMIIARFPGAGRPSPKLERELAAEAAILDEANISARMKLLNETREAAVAALRWRAEKSEMKGESGELKAESGKGRVWKAAPLRAMAGVGRGELVAMPPAVEALRQRALMCGHVHDARRALGMDGTRWKAFLDGTLRSRASVWERLLITLPPLIERVEAMRAGGARMVVRSGKLSALLPEATPEQVAELQARLIPKMAIYGYADHFKRRAQVPHSLFYGLLGRDGYPAKRLNVTQWQRMMDEVSKTEIEEELQRICEARKVRMSEMRKAESGERKAENGKLKSEGRAA